MECGSRVLLGEALILSSRRGRESRGRRVESQEAAPAGTETQFPGRHSNRGRRCLPRAGERARGHDRRDYEPPPASGRSAGGGRGEGRRGALVEQNTSASKGRGEVGGGRGAGGERNGKIAASCLAVRVRVFLRFAMGWALPVPCPEMYLDGAA